jgi:hypothetical protein
MAVFFKGQLLISPTSASVVDDSGLANRNLSVGNRVALLGRSVGGQPKTALRFGTPEQAKAALISGELLDAVLKAFDPSAQTGGPAEVIALRVNPAVQAALTLVDALDADSIDLVSTDYGLRSNQVKVKVESGTTTGKRLTVQMGEDFYSADNITREAFSIQYTGAQASAVMSIDNDEVILEAPSGTTVATIDLATYPTVQQLVDFINTVADFGAEVLDGNGAKAALNGLDGMVDQDVKSAEYTAKADLQACVDWINGVGEGFVDATRATGATQPPVNIGFTYLSGGSDGTVTNDDWSDCYTVLQQIDVQWVAPISGSAAIHAMNDTHVAFMSNQGKMERRGICGTVAGTTDADAIIAAKALNSDRTSLCHIGFYDYDANGDLALFPPYVMAGLLAGAFSGVNPGTPLTNKSLKVRGLERDLRNPTDTDLLITGGVLCIENTPKGFKVVQSITTWLVNENYNRVEVGVGVAVDFTVRNVRDALDDLRGQKGTPQLLSRAVSITESRLRELSRPEPEGPGVLTGDAENPPYRNIRAVLEGDVVRVSYEAQPVIGVNYVLSTCYARAFSGSATA